VHDVDLLRRPGQRAQPLQQPVGIGVAGETIEVADFGVDRHPAAADLDLALTRHHACAARAAGLEAGEGDVVPRLRRQRLKIVQHPPAGGHAAGRDDDGRAGARRGQAGGELEALGLLGDVAHAVGQAARLAGGDAQQFGVLDRQLGRLLGHRAVQPDRHVQWQFAGVAQPLQHQQQCLRAADGEAGQQHRAAALERRAQDLRQARLRVLGWVQAVAVGGLDEHDVRRRRHLRRGHQQVAHAAHVAREQQRTRALAHVDGRGAQQVAAGREAHLGAAQRDAAIARHRDELLQRRLGLAHAVQRQRLLVAAGAVLVGAAGVFLLQVGAVAQQHVAEVTRGGGRVDRPVEALAAQCGQVAAVVQVGVGQQHGVELLGGAAIAGRRERHPVALAQRLEALEQAGVQQ
jgi:hypothetical protein